MNQKKAMKCIKCCKEKSLSSFYFRIKRQKHSTICHDCTKIYSKKYNDNYQKQNKELIKQYNTKYYLDNRDSISVQKQTYYIDNKENIQKYKRTYKKKRRQEDPEYRLREIISNSVYRSLKNGKEGGSCWAKFSYTLKELKKHLELQFQDWMSWENHGWYNLSKLTWQIDHIIPQSELLYNSMDHPNFEKCWSLSNLQPISAKDNLIKSNKLLNCV